MNITDYIVECLQKGKTVEIPGVGTWKSVIENAHFDEESSTFYPTRTVVNFDARTSGNEEFVSYLAATECISADVAKQMLHNYSEVLGEKLANEGKVTIGELGDIRLQDGSKSFTTKVLASEEAVPLAGIKTYKNETNDDPFAMFDPVKRAEEAERKRMAASNAERLAGVADIVGGTDILKGNETVELTPQEVRERERLVKEEMKRIKQEEKDKEREAREAAIREQDDAKRADVVLTSEEIAKKEKAEKEALKEKARLEKEEQEARAKAEREAQKEQERREKEEQKTREKAEREEREAKEKADKEARKEQERREREEQEARARAEKEEQKARERQEKEELEAKKEQERREKEELKAREKAEREEREAKEKAEREAQKEQERREKEEQKAREKAEREEREAKEKADKEARKEQERREREEREARYRAEKEAQMEKERLEKEMREARYKAEKEALVAEQEALKAKAELEKAKAEQEKAALEAKSKAEKEAMKAKEIADKEAKKAKEIADKEAKKAKEIADKEAKKAKEIADKEAKKAKEIAHKEAKKAKELQEKTEKEAKKNAEKEAKKAMKKQKKEERKAAKAAKKQAMMADPLAVPEVSFKSENEKEGKKDKKKGKAWLWILIVLLLLLLLGCAAVYFGKPDFVKPAHDWFFTNVMKQEQKETTELDINNMVTNSGQEQSSGTQQAAASSQQSAVSGPASAAAETYADACLFSFSEELTEISTGDIENHADAINDYLSGFITNYLNEKHYSTAKVPMMERIRQYSVSRLIELYDNSGYSEERFFASNDYVSDYLADFKRVHKGRQKQVMVQSEIMDRSFLDNMLNTMVEEIGLKADNAKVAMPPAPPAPPVIKTEKKSRQGFDLIAGFYTNATTAQKMVDRLKGYGCNAYIIEINHGYYVSMGSAKTRTLAEENYRKAKEWYDGDLSIKSF